MRYLSANQFEVYEEVGKGGFGTVYRGLDKVTKEQVAIKVIDLEDKDYIEDFQKEIQVLSQCKLDQITKYHGCFVKGCKLWIIMEYLNGGSCYDLLAPGIMKEKYIAVILRELLTALCYLHQNSRIHRDIKSANVLLSSQGDVKIADFGVSAQLSNNLSRRSTFVGSPYWMPPEIILEEAYNFKADIWSLGITAIELATGRPPKSHVPPMKALFLIPKSDPPFLDGDQYSSEFKEFVRVCLQKNPSERPSAKKLLEAKFISKAGHTSILVDLIKRRNIWDLQNQDEQKSKKTKRVYVPSVMGSFNAESTRITFDFENISSENSSEVVIAKTSPLKNNSIKLNYLRENNNLLNMRTGEPQDSILVKRNGSSDLSTAALKRHQPGPLPPVGIELSQIFDKTIKKLQPQESDSRKIQEIKKSFEALDENVLVAFLSELTKNVQNSGVLASKEEENIKPKREESEKLLLKRWSEQYFS